MAEGAKRIVFRVQTTDTGLKGGYVKVTKPDGTTQKFFNGPINDGDNDYSFQTGLIGDQTGNYTFEAVKNDGFSFGGWCWEDNDTLSSPKLQNGKIANPITRYLYAQNESGVPTSETIVATFSVKNPDTAYTITVNCKDNGSQSKTFDGVKIKFAQTPDKDNVDALKNWLAANKPTRKGYTLLGFFATANDPQSTKYFKANGTSTGKAWYKPSAGTIYGVWSTEVLIKNTTRDANGKLYGNISLYKGNALVASQAQNQVGYEGDAGSYRLRCALASTNTDRYCKGIDTNDSGDANLLSEEAAVYDFSKREFWIPFTFNGSSFVGSVVYKTKHTVGLTIDSSVTGHGTVDYERNGTTIDGPEYNGKWWGGPLTVKITPEHGWKVSSFDLKRGGVSIVAQQTHTESGGVWTIPLYLTNGIYTRDGFNESHPEQTGGNVTLSVEYEEASYTVSLGVHDSSSDFISLSSVGVENMSGTSNNGMYDFSVKYNSNIKLIATVTGGENYKLAGWYDENGNVAEFEDDGSYKVSGSVKLYARVAAKVTLSTSLSTTVTGRTSPTVKLGGGNASTSSVSAFVPLGDSIE